MSQLTFATVASGKTRPGRAPPVCASSAASPTIRPNPAPCIGPPAAKASRCPRPAPAQRGRQAIPAGTLILFARVGGRVRRPVREGAWSLWAVAVAVASLATSAACTAALTGRRKDRDEGPPAVGSQSTAGSPPASSRAAGTASSRSSARNGRRPGS
jgi:hypothetical protein